MRYEEQFCNSTNADQMPIAERELSAFIRAVTQRFGAEEAQLSALDWLDELPLMDNRSLSISRNWRAVTIAALGKTGSAASRGAASQIRSRL
jgi:hypothetical protein